ncbi:MAG TPA: flagellar export protein FliJ [Methylophilaceae bacterium]|nr:flagellar export protein FliJ [Methylophilaceae bacterium]
MATGSIEIIKMLKEIAEKEVNSATEALADAMKVADEAQSKYDMLVEYQKDYGKNLKKSLETGIGAQAYQNFHSFFSKLDQAVKGQLEMLETAKRHVQLQKRHWKESQRKKLSYEVLEQRQDTRQTKQLLKKDQQLMDEFAMRVGRKAQSNIEKR